MILFSSESGFTISNVNRGIKPDLVAGSQFNITVQGSKPASLSFDENSLLVAFSSLDQPPEPVAELVTDAEVISDSTWTLTNVLIYWCSGGFIMVVFYTLFKFVLHVPLP